MQLKTVAWAVALAAAPALLQAQFEFKLAGRDVQVHSFASQGFAYTDHNNFLTMDTSHGSFAMTDGGVNISSQITEKLRVGAQMYIYNIGQLGQWQPHLDWAFLDYRFNTGFGIRAGRVKTALGLSNDTQDANFLYTWALMPQSVYPSDLRSQNISHNGLDFYGNIGLRRAGSLDYTLYAGLGSIDDKGGRYRSLGFSLPGLATQMTGAAQQTTGGDLRWNTPVTGLTVGTSMNLNKSRNNGMVSFLGFSAPYHLRINPERVFAAYTDYTYDKWHFTAEARRDHSIWLLKYPPFGSDEVPLDESFTGWYVTAAYRVSKWLELGTYRAQYQGVPFDVSQLLSRLGLQSIAQLPGISPTFVSRDNHIYDQAATARVDLTRFWNVKLEGHFMQGYGNVLAAHGFYADDNASGLKPNTGLFVVRTGWNF